MNFEKLAPRGTPVSQNGEVLKATRKKAVMQACIVCLFTATLPVRAIQESQLGFSFNAKSNTSADRLSAFISIIKPFLPIYMQKKNWQWKFFLALPYSPSF